LLKIFRQDLTTEQAEKQFENFKTEYKKDWNNKNDNTSVWDTEIEKIPFSEYFHILRERYFQEKKLNELIKENQNSSKVQEALRKLKPEKYVPLAIVAALSGATLTAVTAGFSGKALFDNSFKEATKTWVDATPTKITPTETTLGTDGHYVDTPATPGNIDNGEALLISLIVIIGVVATFYLVYNLSQTAEYERRDKNKLEKSMDIENLSNNLNDKSFNEINQHINAVENAENRAERVIRNKDRGVFEYVFGM